ncbi:putative transposase/phage integrase [Kitasatospora phosalacinea]|uniref:Transposase/phage integrase n=1 Tax=Kitasatospora phosalacinea TaxID=2065 RepID=A0A9W6QIE1_9ACTN|nr:tyrosine-type recombinase/integrase [Kitasatospora phosalacinea]GLW75486.1 putative transposase/phage integrase [Kitasatospora phosalacinea]
MSDHSRPPTAAKDGAASDRWAQSAALVDGLDPAFAGPLFDPRDERLAGVFMRGSRQVRLDLTALPEVMRREVGWWLATCTRTGERQIHASEWNRWATTAAAVIARQRHVTSFADLPLTEWMVAWARAFHADRDRMPAPGHRLRAEHALRGMLERLLRQYSSEIDWWRHDIWSLRLDPRIPRREHEPRANTAVRWADITPAWLREGTKFYLRLQMESGQLTWSTVMQHRVNTARFAAFVTERGIDHPALAAGSEQSLRSLALEFGTFLHHWRREHSGRRKVGGSLQARTINKNLQTIDLFYRVMADCRAEAAEALDDARWLELTDSHARMFRPADRPRQRELREADERNYINDTDLSSMLTHIEILGLPAEQTRALVRNACQVELAGFGQPAVMRAWLIQALTGRRASEVLLMDFEPLSDIPGLDTAAVPEGGMVARLRYQQTKIDGAPNTILVGRDVVEIVREQQAWVREHWNLGPADVVRYLFPKTTGNRHGTKSWETSNYNRVLKQFSHHLDLRDSRGELLLYSRSHRLRHTKATTLINAGAPIHVVQRYLGHLSPEMTMRYAATLASTAEREFLALAKIGRDGREIGMDRRDMLDLVQLDRRTDRILPNGYCLLPPTRSCDKGNACHGCDHFATDRTFLPDIQRQLAETQALVASRQARHAERYGEPMSAANVWLEQRDAEIRSMQLEITALEAHPADSTAVVRGAGVLGRTGYQNTANTPDHKGT